MAMLENPELLANRSQYPGDPLCESMDEFEQEIEGTRANELLMAHLRMRAQEPAAISLQEVKRRLLSESANPA